jgi:hypothetical protein
MPEPVDFDERAAIEDINRTTDPNELVRKLGEFWPQYHAKHKAHQDAAQMADVFDQSIAAASTLPAFPPPPAFGDGDPGPVPGPDDPGGGGRRPRPPDDFGGMPIPGGPAAPIVGGPPVPGAPVTPVQNLTTPEAFIPNPVEVNVSTGDVHGRGGGAPPVGGLPISGGLGFGDAVGRARDGGVSRGGSGFGSGAGRGASGSGGPGAGVRGPASAAGAMGAGAAAEGRGAGRGAGMGGMPLGGGGRGQGDEDTEHERPEFLVEPDPESVFGTDEATAPPVIGG